MGMIPVLQPDGHLQYPKSDASSSVASSSVFDYMQPYSHHQHTTGEPSNRQGAAAYSRQWAGGPGDYANGTNTHYQPAQDRTASTGFLQPEVSGVGSSTGRSTSWRQPQESSASTAYLQPDNSGAGPSSSTDSAMPCGRHAAHASTGARDEASTCTAHLPAQAMNADAHAATSSAAFSAAGSNSASLNAVQH